MVKEENKIFAKGIVIGNSKFYDGEFIRTSYITDIKVNKEDLIIIIETNSKSLYKLEFSKINCKYIDSTKENFGVVSRDNSFFDKCKKIYDRQNQKTIRKLQNILKVNELYLEVIGVETQKAFYKDNYGKIQKIEVRRHIGMYVDSILITKDIIDFRYFPREIGNMMEVYKWNKELKVIRIKNDGSIDMLLKYGEKSIRCKSAHITLVKYTNILITMED